jgi:dihydrolipoamide dehydrogenase
MQSMARAYDFIVVGGGPAGYVGAIRAAQLGFKTALVENKHLGGICLNWGCIPTKALLKCAEVANVISHAEDFGFSLGKVDFDLSKMVRRSRSISAELATGVEYLMKKNGITVFNGTAKIAEKGIVTVRSENDSFEISANHILLATGARPRELPHIKVDGVVVWSYFQAMTPALVPKRLLVIGSGAIGSEFASFYADMGSDVTLVEMQSRILPSEDADISRLVTHAFKKRGMDVRVETQVSKIDVFAETAMCELTDKSSSSEKIEFDRVILATGIVGNTENLGLGNIGVELSGPFIKVDEWCRTNVAGIYAAGDVAGPPCLAHKASHEAISCVEKIAGVAGAHSIDRESVPACTYCRPEIASVGITEEDAKKRNINIRVGKFDFSANGKAIAIGQTEGFAKVLFNSETGALVGAHMVGPSVTEQIQGFCIGKTLEATESEFIRTMFPHPTVSEAMHEAALDSVGRVIHK